MYRPQRIADRHFTLQNETLAATYAIERDIIRLDERIKHSPCAPAVRKTLVRGDGLGTLNIDKVYPDIYTVMRVETAGYLLNSAQDTDDAIRNLLFEEDHPTIDLSIDVYRYMQAVDWISNPRSRVSVESPDDMLSLYMRCTGGPATPNPAVSFRTKPLSVIEDSEILTTYEPPDPVRLGGLLQDFCDFMSEDTLSPIAQASIVQFQFEALKPFDENLDRMERLLMHYILCRRRLVEHITMPLNLFAAHFKGRFYQLLMPYLTKADDEAMSTLVYVEDLILHMTDVAHELIQFTVSLHKMIAKLIEHWKAKLGRVDKGSALELLLYQFAGTPIMTISQGQNLIGKSFSTTSEALERLEAVGIIRSAKPIRRNKTLEAPEAIMLHDTMYQKRATTIEAWETLEKQAQ